MEHQFPNSAIEKWLDELPIILSPTQHFLGRYTPGKSHPRHHKHLSNRRTLGEMSGNLRLPGTAPPLPPSSSGSSSNPDEPTKSPTKKRRRQPSDTHNALQMPADLDRTPRQMPHPGIFSYQEGVTTYQSSQSSPKSSRASSPSKKIGDLRLLQTGTHVVLFEDESYPLPKPAELFLQKMRKIGLETRIVPDLLKVQLAHLIKEYKLAPSNFCPPSQIDSTAALSGLSVQDTHLRIEEILDAANRCQSDGDAEAGWNDEVHSRVLSLVLRPWRALNQPMLRALIHKNITSARINSQRSITGRSPTKIVDYVIALEPTLQMDKRIISKLKSCLDQSINHTEAEYVRFKPIAVSIETKRPGTDEDGASVQLGIWATAHFTRLRELCSNGFDNAPIFLPQVVVQGHDWSLKIACTMSSHEVVLYGSLPIGNTRSILGFYTLKMHLESLFDWIEVEYVPWFVEHCLD